jgi:inhibitor of KinA
MPSRQWPTYQAVGDAALVVEFGDTIDLEVNQRVQAFARWLQEAHRPGLTDIVPTYRSVLLHYDPLVLDCQEVIAWAQAQYTQVHDHPLTGRRRIEIPTLYGGESGPDLDFVARYHGLSVEDVIRRHSQVDYIVYMMGFMPGFPYLGGLPAELETPRLETPRTLIRAGSVGLAGKQTGIYPLDSPGGWRLIGRTGIRLFDPTLDPPTLLAPGDQVRFVPVSSEEDLGGA